MENKLRKVIMIALFFSFIGFGQLIFYPQTAYAYPGTCQNCGSYRGGWRFQRSYVVPATCTQPAYTVNVYQCTGMKRFPTGRDEATNTVIWGETPCQYCTTESIPVSGSVPLGHDYQTATMDINCGLRTAATCESPATYYQKCSRCNARDENRWNTVGEKLGHIWDAGVITTEPTINTTGTKTFTCARDSSHVVTVTEPKLDYMIFINDKRVNFGNLLDAKIKDIRVGDVSLVKKVKTAEPPEFIIQTVP